MIVTPVPATGLVEVEDTRYFVALPGVVVIVEVTPVLPPVVAVTVVAVPETVCVVKTTVAIPLMSVFDVEVAKDPFPFDFVQVTVSPPVETGLLFASAS